jgi:hypothetical protein
MVAFEGPAQDLWGQTHGVTGKDGALLERTQTPLEVARGIAFLLEVGMRLYLEKAASGPMALRKAWTIRLPVAGWGSPLGLIDHNHMAGSGVFENLPRRVSHGLCTCLVHRRDAKMGTVCRSSLRPVRARRKALPVAAMCRLGAGSFSTETK